MPKETRKSLKTVYRKDILPDTFCLELKINRGPKSVEDAKKQLDRYLDRLGLSEGYLILLDPGKGDYEKKLYMKETTHNQKKITMVGC